MKQKRNIEINVKFNDKAPKSFVFVENTKELTLHIIILKPTKDVDFIVQHTLIKPANSHKQRNSNYLIDVCNEMFDCLITDNELEKYEQIVSKTASMKYVLYRRKFV